VELLRDNLPTGAITADTYAVSAVGGDDESQWFAFNVSADALLAGANVLAVEVHQRSASSTDVSFDLALEALRPQEPHDPIMLEADTTVKARVLYQGQWSALNEAYFTIEE
jgi:hypothetical protein